MPRGVKTCPQCGTTCGPRTRQCSAAACDHQYPIKGKTSSPPADRPSPGPPSIGPPSLSKPSGPPSIPLKVKPTVEPGDAPVVITDREKLNEFIEQLKSCSKRSNHNGGGYSCFLHHKNGVLQIDVCLEMRIP